MRITWAQVALILWFAVLLASLGIAVLLAVKKAARGVLWGLLTVCGALLMGSFVSAIAGLYEVKDYLLTFQCLAFIAWGCAGLAVFLGGIRKVRARDRALNT